MRRYLGDAANEEVYCELRYQGQLYDAETGLYYNRHRYYDAESRQYISPDPIGLGGGIRPQGYVHNPLEWVDPFGLSGLDITGRPLSSPNYSVWYQTEIPADLRNGSRLVHFQNANQQLYNSIQQNPGLSTKLPPEVVNHVQPGPKGAFARTSPPNHTWHHNAQSPEKIELVPRGQHQAPGNVQSTLHPNQEGGFKKLGSGKKCG